MAPIREYPAVIHGQHVTVKVYPAGGLRTENNWVRSPKGGFCHSGLHNHYVVDQGFWTTPTATADKWEPKAVDMSDCEP